MELLKSSIFPESLGGLTGTPLNTGVVHKAFDEECARGYCVPLTLLASETKHCRQRQRVTVGYSFWSMSSGNDSCGIRFFRWISHCWNVRTVQFVLLAVPAGTHPFEDFSISSLLTVVLKRVDGDNGLGFLLLQTELLALWLRNATAIILCHPQTKWWRATRTRNIFSPSVVFAHCSSRSFTH